MDNPLSTYLHDHLAGARIALDLLDILVEGHAGEPVGRLAAELKPEIDQDRETLRRLSERVGPPASAVKEAAAWLSEKASHAKFQRKSSRDLGTYQAIEALALGILGKEKLWRALAAAAPGAAALQGPDYDDLIARAASQHERAEAMRLALAPGALRSPGGA